jgi:uncharacterized membrane protein
MAVFGFFVTMMVLLAILLALAIPLLIIWFIAVVIRDVAGSRHGASGPYNDPAAVSLHERLMRGEITPDQFDLGMYELGYERVP